MKVAQEGIQKSLKRQSLYKDQYIILEIRYLLEMVVTFYEIVDPPNPKYERTALTK